MKRLSVIWTFILALLLQSAALAQFNCATGFDKGGGGGTSLATPVTLANGGLGFDASAIAAHKMLGNHSGSTGSVTAATVEVAAGGTGLTTISSTVGAPIGTASAGVLASGVQIPPGYGGTGNSYGSGGVFGTKLVNTAGATSLTSNDGSLVYVDMATAGGNVTLNLPAANGAGGTSKIFVIVLLSSNGLYSLTVHTAGSDDAGIGNDIDVHLPSGSTGACVTFMSDGLSQWHMFSESPSHAYYKTITADTLLQMTDPDSIVLGANAKNITLPGSFGSGKEFSFTDTGNSYSAHIIPDGTDTIGGLGDLHLGSTGYGCVTIKDIAVGKWTVLSEARAMEYNAGGILYLDTPHVPAVAAPGTSGNIWITQGANAAPTTTADPSVTSITLSGSTGIHCTNQADIGVGNFTGQIYQNTGTPINVSSGSNKSIGGGTFGGIGANIDVSTSQVHTGDACFCANTTSGTGAPYVVSITDGVKITVNNTNPTASGDFKCWIIHPF